MSEPAELPDHVVSIHIDVPVERVWDEITKAGRVQRALYNTVLETELRPGARLRYSSPNGNRVFIIGEVVEVEAPHRFSHTYWFTMWKGGGPTLVLSLPLTREARVEASNEIEWSPKGVVLESFLRRGLVSFGGHAFYDDSERYLVQAVATGSRMRFFWTGVGGHASAHRMTPLGQLFRSIRRWSLQGRRGWG